MLGCKWGPWMSEAWDIAGHVLRLCTVPRVRAFLLHFAWIQLCLSRIPLIQRYLVDQRQDSRGEILS